MPARREPKPTASTEPRALDAAPQPEDVRFDRTLRPKTFDDYIGQAKHKDHLSISVRAARGRGEPLDHILLSGPPGLGKTTLAQILAHEMGVNLVATNGPVVEHKGALAGLLTKLARNDILFIDEIHRLNPVVEESLYPAMEDFRIDVMTGEGAFADALQIPIQPFTLVGATTRTGLLSTPLRSRFGHAVRLDFYPPEDLAKIVTRSARMLEVPIDAEAATLISERSRGTPRLANRLLRRVRDYADVVGTGRIDRAIVASACEKLEIDAAGFDEMDRRLLRVIIDDYEGGPVGLDTLAATIGEPSDTLEDVYEPYLLQQGFLGRTPRGRIAMKKAYDHLGIPRVATGDPDAVAPASWPCPRTSTSTGTTRRRLARRADGSRRCAPFAGPTRKPCTLCGLLPESSPYPSAIREQVFLVS